MDHLTDDHGASGILPEWVHPDEGLEDAPKDKPSFHSYPDRKGWRLEHDHKLELQEDTNSTESFGVFLQSWLFFGLILTVVQVDGRPVLKYEDLRRGSYLDTKMLRGALQKWAVWELSHPDGIEFRMIQVGYILETAQKVVRKNCGYNYELETDQVEYSTTFDGSRHLTDECAIALMTVGETLTAVKMKIMEDSEIKTNIPGWHSDDDGGWGPPRWVFEKMRKDRWCPRAVHLLKGQLRSNATMLLAAYTAYRDSGRMTLNHENCDKTVCKSQPLDKEGNYTCCHIPGCHDYIPPGMPDLEKTCLKKGPNMNEILQILKSEPSGKGRGLVKPGSDIPLLEFVGAEEAPIQFKVTRRSDVDEFATISHVWSDGWGNTKENQLQECQLRFIRRQLKQANEKRDIPFWMDTLICPVGEDTPELTELKKKSIGQIFDVFQESAFTVVIDNGLWSMTKGDFEKPAQAAMRILASGWMRRLWTLQEAFVSKKLYIIFKEGTRNHDNLENLDMLGGRLQSPKDMLTAPLMKMVRDQLLHNIMGHEREHRNFFLQSNGSRARINKDKAATLVVNAWRAARWRTTSKEAHETLALATLLDLDYQGTKIEEAGLTKNADTATLDDLVKDFWLAFNSQYEGAIPPGIIFLPGQKVHGHAGFGWAPRTWMSPHEVDYPDPLSKWNSPTTLEPGGLGVKYPGFLLHMGNKNTRRTVLGTNNTSHHFTFPVDRKLLEWYNAKPADSQPPSHIDAIARSKRPLAIVLSRPHPGESPYEIGLLVEIHGRTSKKTQDGEEVFNCYVVQRLHVWRETTAPYLTGAGRGGLPIQKERGQPDHEKGMSPHWKIIAGSPKDTDFNCIGEVLGPNQSWVVDGSSHLYPAVEKRSESGGVEGSESLPESLSESLPKRSRWFDFFRATKPITKATTEPAPGDIRSSKTLPPNGSLAASSSGPSTRRSPTMLF